MTLWQGWFGPDVSSRKYALVETNEALWVIMFLAGFTAADRAAQP